MLKVKVLAVAAMLVTAAAGQQASAAEPDTPPAKLDHTTKQEEWRNCVLQLTPSCLKLGLSRLVSRLAQNTYLQLLPGVVLSANRSRSLELEAESSRDLDSLLVQKVIGYLRSLTLSFRVLDLPALNSTDLLDTVTGRKKGGVGAGGAMAVMMGGATMTMMMSALAAMAGKALMTAMMALLLAAMGAMKGQSNGGKSTTYEIIKDSGGHHSAEHWGRSLDSRPWEHLHIHS